MVCMLRNTALFVYIYIRVFVRNLRTLQSTCKIHAYLNACRITKPSMNSICALWIKKNCQLHLHIGVGRLST